jgi:hypothetical protein
MIHFALRCARGDQFDGWFRGNADFDAQLAAKEIACPFCGSVEICKDLMTPALGSRRGEPPPETAALPPGAAEGAETVRLANGPDPRMAEALEMIREIGRRVRATSDYVGRRFAEEARKIHYQEASPRSIYGEATAEEAEELADDGIGFHPMPVLPEERN